MSALPLASTAAGALLALLALGVPVAYALGAVASAGLILSVGSDFLFATFKTLPYSFASQYAFVVVPMFVLMGTISARIGIISDLYAAAYRLSTNMKGGLLASTILSSAGFAAISGSTVVSASVFSKIALPEMQRYGYKLGVAAGCIAAAGTLSAMIPPSLAMVLFGILTNESIGALLLAGLLPGLMTAVAYMIGIRVFLVFFPDWAPTGSVKFTFREKLESLAPVGWVAVLAAFILGGIYTGAFSPSAAGAVGAAGAIAIGIARGRLARGALPDALKEAGVISAALFTIIIAGLLFSRFLLSTGLIRESLALINAYSIGPTEFVFVLVIVYLVLGMFVDGASVMVITLPFLFPIAKELGVDGIWMGVIVVKLIEIAAITPPVGLNLFAVLGATRGTVSSEDLFKGVVPFIVIEMITLAILIQFPEISTWLPKAMLNR